LVQRTSLFVECKITIFNLFWNPLLAFSTIRKSFSTKVLRKQMQVPHKEVNIDNNESVQLFHILYIYLY